MANFANVDLLKLTLKGLRLPAQNNLCDRVNVSSLKTIVINVGCCIILKTD